MIEFYSIKLLIAYIWTNYVLLPNQFADISYYNAYMLLLENKIKKNDKRYQLER